MTGITIWLIGLIVIGIMGLGLIGFLLFARNERMDSCTEIGGVPVQSHLGKLYCFDPDALLEGWPE